MEQEVSGTEIAFMKCHGLGLQNVKSAIERNGGFFKIVSKRDSFEIKIQLYNDR